MLLLKRIISILTIIAIVLSFPISFAKKGDISQLDTQCATAYGEAVADIVSRIKDMTKKNTYTLSFNSGMPEGMSYSNLVDFNGDGTYELVAFYFANGAYNCEVWTLEDKNALQLTDFSEKITSSSGDSETIYLSDTNDGAEIIIYKQTNENNETIDVFSVKDKAWKNIKSYKMSESAGENGETSVNCTSYEDGIENNLAKNEYDAVKGLYINDALDELMKVDVNSNSIYVNKIKSDVNHTEELNKLSTQITSFVNSFQNKSIEDYSYSDVISSLSADEKDSLTKLLSYFTGWGFDGNIRLDKPYNDIVEFVAYKTAQDNLTTVKSSDSHEKYIMLSADDVNNEFEKKFGFYPNEVYYNTNYVNTGVLENGFYHIPNIANNALKTSIQPSKMYKISEEVYFVPFTVYTWNESSDAYQSVNVNLYKDNWSASQNNSAKQAEYGYAVLKKSFSHETPYVILDYKTGCVFPSEDVLNEYAKEIIPSEIPFNYSLKFKSQNDYTRELESAISSYDGDSFSFSDGESIRDFIEFSLTSYASKTVRASGNHLDINTSDIIELDSNIKDLSDAFDESLKKNNASLNGKIKNCIKLYVNKVSEKSPVRITIDKKDINSMKNSDSLLVQLGSASYSVTLDKNNIEKALKITDKITIEIEKNNDLYVINFLNANGKQIKKLPDCKIKFAFPCEYDYNTVFNNVYNENQGGLYNYLNESIEFYTDLGGEYEVGDNKKTISDENIISSDDKKAVEFLVSRDILTLDGRKFNPDEKMTRNDVTRAIVKMLYCYDKDAKYDYTDVASDDKYYPYIASSFENGLINGFGDDTFRGDGSVTREAMISLCSRILSADDRYIYNNFTASDVDFFDYQTITGWDNQKNEVYLASSLGIVNYGGLLLPRTDITRIEGAKILYKLYNTLYKVGEAKTLTGGTGISEIGIYIGIISLVVIVIFVVIAAVLKHKKKRRIKTA